MTLWSIARSPLMMGGDLTKLDDFTLGLLTNDEVLAVNQASERNRPLFERDDLVAWIADVPGSPDRYLAVFNARDPGAGASAGVPVAVPLRELGFSGPVRVRDLWAGREVGEFSGEFVPVVAWHGAGLYRLSRATR